LLQLVPASRLARDPDVETPFEMRSPVYPAYSILLNPAQPRTHEATGDPAAQPFVGIVGAAWLLMSQTNVSTLRVIDSAPSAQEEASPDNTDTVESAPDAASGTRRPRPPSTVTLVELRSRSANRRTRTVDGARAVIRGRTGGRSRRFGDSKRAVRVGHSASRCMSSSMSVGRAMRRWYPRTASTFSEASVRTGLTPRTG